MALHGVGGPPALVFHGNIPDVDAAITAYRWAQEMHRIGFVLTRTQTQVLYCRLLRMEPDYISQHFIPGLLVAGWYANRNKGSDSGARFDRPDQDDAPCLLVC